MYLAQNKLPSIKTAICKVEMLAEKYILLDSICKVEMLAEKYILLDSLLFKIITTPKKEMALLAITEVCMDKVIMLYHYSLFAGCQAIIKTYLTIDDKYFIPGLLHYLH